MKKIVSLIIFIATLVWSWNLIHSASAVGFETHSGIQQRLAQIIVDTLASKKPEAKNIQVTRLWTETLSNNKVRAVFAYSFQSPGENGEAIEQSVEGEAVLYREPSEDPNEDRWVLQSVRTTNDSLVFSEGSTISPNMTLEEEGSVTGVDPSPASPAEGSQEK